MSEDLKDVKISVTMSMQKAKHLAALWINIAKKLGLSEFEVARLMKDLDNVGAAIEEAEALTVEFRKNLNP